jgi:hypothetical protein
MKTLLLICVCVTMLTQCLMSAEIYIWQEGVRDDGAKDDSSEQLVYVLMYPVTNGIIKPIVFKQFDSKQMEDTITFAVKFGDIKAGSTLVYYNLPSRSVSLNSTSSFVGSALQKIPDWAPSEEKRKGFEAFCRKLGLTFIVGPMS